MVKRGKHATATWSRWRKNEQAFTFLSSVAPAFGSVIWVCCSSELGRGMACERWDAFCMGAATAYVI